MEDRTGRRWLEKISAHSVLTTSPRRTTPPVKQRRTHSRWPDCAWERFLDSGVSRGSSSSERLSIVAIEFRALFPQVEGGNTTAGCQDDRDGQPSRNTDRGKRRIKSTHTMKDAFFSRRRCLQVSALAGCSMLLGGRVSAAEEPLPADHIRPGPVTLQGARQLRSFMEHLSHAPPPPAFNTLPIILQPPL